MENKRNKCAGCVFLQLSDGVRTERGCAASCAVPGKGLRRVSDFACKYFIEYLGGEYREIITRTKKIIE